MGGIVNKLAFHPPSCTYSTELKDLIFITRTENDCSIPNAVTIPIRRHIIGSHLPTIIWCHGNAMDIGMMDLNYISTLLNANIITYDYASYGLHSKKNPSEQDCYKDIEAVYYQYVLPLVKNPNKITILGHSLGSAFACHLAFITKHDTHQPKNLILISPLYSGTALKTWFPIPFIDCFKNYTLAPFIKCSVVIYHSEADEIIPFSCAKELSLKFKNLIQLHTIHNRNHNDTMNDPIVFSSIQSLIHFSNGIHRNRSV